MHHHRPYSFAFEVSLLKSYFRFFPSEHHPRVEERIACGSGEPKTGSMAEQDCLWKWRGKDCFHGRTGLLRKLRGRSGCSSPASRLMGPRTDSNVVDSCKGGEKNCNQIGVVITGYIYSTIDDKFYEQSLADQPCQK